MFTKVLKYIVLAVFSLGAFHTGADAEILLLRKKAPAKKAAAKSSKSKKKSSSKRKLASRSRSKSRRTPKRAIFRERSPEIGNSGTVLKDTMLATGVQYQHLLMGADRHSVHVVRMDRTNPAHNVELIKGGDICNGLECLNDMTARYDSTNSDKVLAAVNAHFWSAYGNRPIGPTVINGEVVEMLPYKRWTSGFFSEDNKLYIDHFEMRASVRFSNKRAFSISSVNFRTDENGAVLYNSYGGDVIPYVSGKDINKALDELKNNRVESTGDSTEELIDEEQLRAQLAEMRRTANQEFSMPKIQVRYLRNPAVNREVACLVLAADTMSMKMPVRGAVISFGKNFSFSQLPKPGDTVFVNFSTDDYSNVEFFNAVSGTPRLVRNGRAGHEAHMEGSPARRFVSHNLARTAVGYDQENDQLLLVSVEATGKREGSMGATLAQMANIMKTLGAYNAMNLDGGGSATMVVGRDMVTHAKEIFRPRKISVGLGVVRKAFIRRTSLN